MPKLGNSSSQFPESRLPGVFIKEVTIAGLETESDATNFNGDPADFSVIFSLQDGQFNNFLFIKGNWPRLTDGSIDEDNWGGWGPKLKNLDILLKNAKVGEALTTEQKLDFEIALENGVIPDYVQKLLVGKKLKSVQFVKGTYKDADGNIKPSYKTWEETFPVNTINATIENRFEKSMNRIAAAGYTTPYKPDVLNTNGADSSKTADEQPADSGQPPTEELVI